jgi:hypothetical protein
MAEKCKVLKVLRTREWGEDMVCWYLQVRWGSSNGPVEDVEVNAKRNGRKYAEGDLFDGEKSTDAQGRIKVKNVTQSAGFAGRPGGGGGRSGGGSWQRRPPAEVPWADAVKLFKQAAVDLGVTLHSEHVSSLMIAMFNGDVLRPGQKLVLRQPEAPPPAQARPAASTSSAPPPPPPPPNDDEWS